MKRKSYTRLLLCLLVIRLAYPLYNSIVHSGCHDPYIIQTASGKFSPHEQMEYFIEAMNGGLPIDDTDLYKVIFDNLQPETIQIESWSVGKPTFYNGTPLFIGRIMDDDPDISVRFDVHAKTVDGEEMSWEYVSRQWGTVTCPFAWYMGGNPDWNLYIKTPQK